MSADMLVTEMSRESHTWVTHPRGILTPGPLPLRR
jgi:hypothetical protein